MTSPSGTESIELSDAKELLVVSTNEAERQLAITRFNEAIQASLEKGRSKSKSPRRTRKDRHDGEEIPPSPAWKVGSTSASTGSVTGASGLTASGGGGGSSSKTPAPRRPHTSAGPRDKASFDFAGARLESAYNREQRVNAEDVQQRRPESKSKSNSRPSTSQGESKGQGRSRSTMKGYSFFGSAPRIGTALSGSSSGTNGSATGTSRSATSSVSSASESETGDDKMREWEEELAKIEMKSRKSSDMLGFAGKRKRSAGPPRLT